MNSFALTGLVNGIVSIFFCLLVYSRNKNVVNKTFTSFILMVALWSLGYWQWQSATNSLNALFWIKIFTVGSIFIPPTFFHWVTSLVNQEKKYRKYTFSIYAISLVFAALIFKTNLIIKSLEPRLFFDYWPIPGSLYSVYIGLYFIVLCAVLYTLGKNIGANANITEKRRLKLVFWGTIIGFSGGATNFLLWYGIPIPPYGNFLVSVGALTWGYSAAKYNLFNSKVIATEFFAFILWLVFLVKLLISSGIGDFVINAAILIITIIFGILLVKSVNDEIKAKEKIEKLAKDLEKANARLRELDKQKSEFLSFATHQLRSPLTAIKGYASLIQEETFGKIERPLREAVDHIFQATEGMIFMVEDFLNISRIEQGRMKYEFEDLDITKLTEEIALEMKPVAEKKGLELIFNKKDELVNVSADPGKLRQVIANIVDNSIKYTQKGSINVHVEKVGMKAHIIIKDTGIGISEKEIEVLFEKFSRAKNANRINVTGTGLGLYLAKKIIEEHKGNIVVSSEGEGKGSVFEIELPLK
ncbi:MAG: ATP-binding protein [Patescibacteria group bacterium]